MPVVNPGGVNTNPGEIGGGEIAPVLPLTLPLTLSPLLVSVKQGDENLLVSFILSDVNGPVDLTDSSAEIHVKGGAVAFAKAVELDLTTQGKVNFRLQSAQSAIVVNKARLEIAVTFESGIVATFPSANYGMFTVLEGMGS